MPLDSAQRRLLHVFPSFSLGGSQARFVKLANHFGDRYRHHIVAMDGCYDAGHQLQPHLRWEPLQLLHTKGATLANQAAYRRVLSTLKPDLLLTYNWGSIEWAAANLPRRAAQAHIEDGFGPEEATRQLQRRVWARWALLGLAKVPVFAASRHLARIAVGQWHLPPARVGFIPNGVALPPAPTADLPLHHPGKPLTIGTVAMLRPEKNIARLLRAFAALRSTQAARLVVVGDGPDRAALEALAKALNLGADVQFAGFQSNPQPYLAEFDVFALSSDTEQLPIALLEAMASGLPVVATRVGDVPLVVPAEAQACLAAPEDADFTRCLLQVVQSPGQWRAWTLAGRAQVERHYSVDVMQQRWRALFDGDMAFALQGGC